MWTHDGVSLVGNKTDFEQIHGQQIHGPTNGYFQLLDLWKIFISQSLESGPQASLNFAPGHIGQGRLSVSQYTQMTLKFSEFQADQVSKEIQFFSLESVYCIR